jgi:putative transposase
MAPGTTSPYTPPEKPAGTVNVSDPDSRVVQSRRGFLQVYTAQAVATPDQIAITADVIAGGNERITLEPLIDKAHHELEQVHGWFQRFAADGVLQEIWAALVAECDPLGAVGWGWQAADGVLGKSRFEGGARGPNPTDRGKSGTKKSVLVEQDGGPLGVVIAGANRNDCKLLDATINAIVIDRPDPAQAIQNLCLDKGYDNPSGEAACEAGGYAPHIRRIGEEKLDSWGNKTHPARRWVVERTIAWLQKCRALLIRYDKKAVNYLGLIQLACALLWYRRRHQLQQDERVYGWLLRGKFAVRVLLAA